MKTYRKLMFCCGLLLATIQFSFAQVTKKVLVEKYTCNSCGSCPDGAIHLVNVLDTTPNVIWVSQHIGWWDPMRIIALDSMYHDFAVGTPMITVDRTQFGNASNVALFKSQWESRIQQQVNMPTDVEVTMGGTTFDNQQVEITVNAKFLSTPSLGDYRLNLFVVEDSIIGFDSTYNQVNYHDQTPGHYYQGAGLSIPYYNYPYRHVVRMIPSHIWGTGGIIPTFPTTNTTYTKSYTFTLPSNYDINQIRFVGFVSQYNNDVYQREVLNAEELYFNELSITTSTESIVSKLPFTLQIAPNPVQTQLNLFIQSKEDLENSEIQIVDVMGRRVKTVQDILIAKGENVMVMDVTPLNSGLYFLQFRNGQKVRVKRFVVQR